MTLSIVARDALSGELGAATATAGPAVGALVIHGQSGVGAIATQAFTNPLFGPDGLTGLAEGQSAQAVLESLLAQDPERQRRQLILLDAGGGSAHWTGGECGGWCGSLSGEGFAVAGNLLAGDTVLPAMCDAFTRGAGLPLAERLLAALQAGQRAGGDRRGLRSAALKVWQRRRYAQIDLRVDWAADPLTQLDEVLAQVRAPDYADFFAQLPGREAE